MNNRNLHNKLSEYCDLDILPMHMPGGKRSVGSYAAHDITEINGFDNLHDPCEVIKDLESDLADIWKADEAFLSVNGSTAMIEAAICSAMKYYPDGKVLAASNCHLSVWHGIEMAGSMHVIADPEIKDGIPFTLEVLPQTVEDILSSDSSIKAVVITSPTYEGVISDTGKIYEIAQRHGCTLIVDEAHGAHFGLDDFWGGESFGDLVIKSTHKTLSSPTQTAVMLKFSDRIDTRDIRHYIDIFESTSPSYLLMSGVSEMAELLHKKDALKEWEDAVEYAEEKLSGLKNIKMFKADNKDRSKFVFICNGIKCAEILRNEYRIEVEAADLTMMTAMTGIGDNKESLARFAEAMTAIDNDHPEVISQVKATAAIPKHITRTSLRIAAGSKSEKISKYEAAGRISSEFIYSYPPGIPVILPGDEITKEQCCLIRESISVLA